MKKFGELIVILDLHRQGLKVSMIARQLGLSLSDCLHYGIPAARLAQR